MKNSFNLYRYLWVFQSEDYVKDEISSKQDSEARTIIKNPGLFRKMPCEEWTLPLNGVIAA